MPEQGLHADARQPRHAQGPGHPGLAGPPPPVPPALHTRRAVSKATSRSRTSWAGPTSRCAPIPPSAATRPRSTAPSASAGTPGSTIIRHRTSLRHRDQNPAAERGGRPPPSPGQRRPPASAVVAAGAARDTRLAFPLDRAATLVVGMVHSAPAPAAAGPDQLGGGRLRPAPLHPDLTAERRHGLASRSRTRAGPGAAGTIRGDYVEVWFSCLAPCHRRHAGVPRPRHGVDVGTANTPVYVRRRGIALNKPSVVALNTNPGQDRRNRRSGETARYLTSGLTSPNLSSILGRVENIPAKTGRIPRAS